MYNMSSKLLNSIGSTYVNDLSCIRAKEDESKCFQIDSCVG